MTLIDVVNNFKDIAIQQHNINYVGDGDIYSLNNLPNLDYGVFYVTQTNHTQSEDTISYTLTLFYVDRLFTDHSNRLQIQSNAIITLANIINIFAETYDVEVGYDINYTTFIQRFTDECSGAFCNVTITVDNNIGLCGYR